MKGATVFLLITVFPLLSAGETAPSTTLTGWFIDEWCAPARLKAKTLGPVNRECAQRCIAEGAKVVFLDQTSRRILPVANAQPTRGQESHYVRVVGSLDSSRGLHVKAVEVLEEYRASCALPREDSEGRQ